MPVGQPRQTTQSKLREGLASAQQMTNDAAWVQYQGSVDMETDGPRLWVNRAHAIILDPVVERRVTFTRPSRLFIQNAQPRITFLLWGDTGTGDVSLTLSVWGHKLGEDPESAGTLIHTSTLVVAIPDTTLQQAEFDSVVLDDPNIRHDHEILTFELNHDPAVPANTYGAKVYLSGCRFHSKPNIPQ